MLALRIVDEMAELSGHRAEIADLPEQPFQHFFASAPRRRHEATGFLGEMDQDRAGFEDRERTVRLVMIDDGRHAVVWADREEFRLELVALADIDRHHPVFEAAFLEQDRDLPAVRRRPVIKIDHVPPLHLEAVMICACILPSIGPGPKLAPSAAAAASVTSARRPAARVSISLRSGVPWQKPIAGSRGDGARLRRETVSTAISENPAERNSRSIVTTSW